MAAKAVPAPEPSLSEKIIAKRQEVSALNEQRRTLTAHYESVQSELELLESKQRLERNDALLRALKLNPDLLNVLAPEHSRSSCNDKQTGNADRGCVRCLLLDSIGEDNLDEVWSFRMEFDRVRG